MTDEQNFQIELYGKILVGDETELEKSKLSRIQFLKTKMRPRLSAEIGDLGDNITDITRAITIGEAIRTGIETDQKIIDRYFNYVKNLYSSYGGGGAIMDVLEFNAYGLQSNLVGGYYVAKQQILMSEKIEDVQKVDLPGEPETTENI